MRFFYNAMKRAAGVPVETEELRPMEVAVEADASGALESAFGHAVAARARVTSNGTTAATAPARTLPFRARHEFSLKHPIASLVAFLSAPILEPNIFAMEQVRVLRTRFLSLAKQKGLRTVLITSALPEEGKTVVSLNLATALSQLENTRVLLIDCDLRSPGLARLLKLTTHQGLAAYLSDASLTLEDVSWQATPNLTVIPSRQVDEHTAELLNSGRMRQLLKEAAANFDYVLLDTSPLLPIADTQTLVPQVDGAILVARAHRTPTELAKEAADLLGAKLVSCVLNGARNRPHSKYGSYGYGYGKKQKAANPKAAKKTKRG